MDGKWANSPVTEVLSMHEVEGVLARLLGDRARKASPSCYEQFIAIHSNSISLGLSMSHAA